MAFTRVGQALTALEIRELVSAELELVEREISLESVAPVDVITAIGHHLQGNGGKRLRPMLVLLSAKLFGNANESAIRMGAVVEMAVSYTLIHDDVIDD